MATTRIKSEEMNPMVTIANCIVWRAIEINNPNYTPVSSKYAVLPPHTYADFCLYPNFAILVIKEKDLQVLTIGKKISGIKKLMTLDFYDERVDFFQHKNHVGHIAFVNMSQQDMVDGDFGNAVHDYCNKVTNMFGDLTIGRNYKVYESVRKITDDYKFINFVDAEPMIATNNRILAVIKADGTIDVLKVRASR